MKYLVTERNMWWGPINFPVADGEGNEVFRIALDKSHRWTLHDTFGNPLTVLRIWDDGTFGIERAGEVIATIRRVRPARGNPKYEVLLATGARLLVSRNPNGQKYEVHSVEGQPFCRLELRGTRHIVEVEAEADLVLTFSVIVFVIRRQFLS